jgi:threonine/homoserine/homoserine lactone efflux protein
MTPPKKRLGLAVFIAAGLALPTLFEQPWHNTFAAISMTVVNSPGILLTGRFFPPEGFPGQSPLHAVVMVVVQSVCWFLVLYAFAWMSRRRSSKIMD